LHNNVIAKLLLNTRMTYSERILKIGQYLMKL